MKFYIKSFLLLLLSIFAFSSCEENLDTDEEFVNWKEKNTEAFQKKLNEAHFAIAQAKATYGADWEAHCDWRAFRTYTQAPDTQGKAEDSICVKIMKRGTGEGCPLYTDSVSVNYLGRLIPSPTYPDGYVFDHSSKGQPVEDVFNPEFSTPARFLVSNNIEGFTTVLQKMHIGDRWMVYIPSSLAYRDITNQVIPAYSMLSFDLELVAYSHPGNGK